MAPYVTQDSGQQNTEAFVRVFGVFVQKLVMVPIKKKTTVLKELKELRGLRAQRCLWILR